jgi:hypothetical protein
MRQRAERAGAWAHQWRAPLIVAGLVLGVVLLVLVPATYVTVSSARRAEQLAAQVDTGTFDKDRAEFRRNLLQYETDSQVKVWTGLLQAATAIAAGAAGLIAWRNLRETQRKLDVDREGQVTNRFTQAIEQLGSMRDSADGKKVPNLEVRLGGIYALQRIAKDSPRDHWTIIEMLTAYVRENAPSPPRSRTEANSNQEVAPSPARPDALIVPAGALWSKQVSPERAESSPPKPRTDVQAILTVLGRRRPPEDFPEPGRLDLTGTDLRGANFRKAQLAEADFEGAYLAGAVFGRADLLGAHSLTPDQVLSTLNLGRDVAELPSEWTPEQRAEVQRRWEEEEVAEEKGAEAATEQAPTPAVQEISPLNGTPPAAPDPAAAPPATDRAGPPAGND